MLQSAPDLLGRLVDRLPLRPIRGAKSEPAPRGTRAVVVSVIEPDAGQFIGALVLGRSLRRSPTPVAFHLCIADRGSGAPGLLAAGRALGLDCAAAPPRHGNPFLNKWLAFETFAGLRKEPHVLLLDWDMLLCGAQPLPGPFGPAVAARRNPSGMYRDLTGRAFRPLPRTPAFLWGRVRSSVNGGVLVGSGESLARCADRTAARMEEITGRVPDAPPWKVEQLALSLAVGELGLVSLDRRWNVTPQPDSPVADPEVRLWHYNDGVEASRELKRCLARPRQASVQLGLLAARWPSAVAAFREGYDEVLALDPVSRWCVG